MITKYFGLLMFASVISACAAPLATQVQSGRTALMAGDAERAIVDFTRVAESQPDYVFDLPPLRQGIWTYLGRAYYNSGKLPQAREALSQALKHNDGEFMARLYYSLTLLRLQGPPPGPDNSLSLNDILFALKEKVSLIRLASLIKERGVDFVFLTPENERELRKAGADNEIIEQTRISAKARATSKQNAWREALRDVEQALKQIQNWQVGIRKSEYERFWDRRKRISAQVEASLSMISNKRTSREDFIPGLEQLGRMIEEEVDIARKEKAESDGKAGARPG